MGLSSDLISQFVKITKDKETSKGESTTYGTIVKYNGKTYAKLDGSELLTPVTTTTDVEENERVTVTIKNHTATVTGNISSPSARTDTVKEIDKEVTVIGNKISEFEIVIADKVSTTELDAEKARIDDLTADNVTIKEKLTAAEADIDTLTVDNITIKEKVSASEAEITTIKATNVTISGKVSANEADIDKLTTDYAVVNEKLIANSASIDILEANNATITGKLTAAEADISTLEADNVNINSKLNANEADINSLKANSLTADSAVIKNLQSDVADIDTLIFGSASGNSIQTSFANAVIAQLGNAQIKSAMIESVSASKITAGDIITNNVRVMSEDGSLIISDETLQISDGARVRVQIGKDASNDYSINIWDTNGNLMFSKGGITDAAIKNAIIRNDMVAANANISASKLDIDSLFTEINNSSKNIKSTKVYFDDKGQTLDAAFTSMTTDVNGIRGTVESQGTQISVMQGQIANKIWQTDIDTTIDKLEIGGRNLLRNSRLIKPSSNNAGLYPIGLETVTENNITFYRVTRGSVDLNPTTFSIYNTIGKDSFNHTEMNGKTVVLSFKARASHATKMTLTSCATDPMTTFSKNNASESITTDWMTYTQVVDEFPDMSNMHCVRFSPLNITIPSGVNVSDFYIDVREWKFELGNKATDWTPAPEDVEGKISTLSTKYSEVKQTVDGLSTTVAAHTAQISNKADSSTVTTVNNKVSALEQNLDGFKTTVSNTYTTKTEFDNLEIGGRNLWITSSLIDAYDNQQGGYVSSPDMPAHKYLDVFIDTSGNDYLYFQLWNPNKIHNSTYANRVAFFDSNKTYISYVKLPYLLNEPYIKLLIPIPATAAYVKLAAIVGTPSGVDNDIKVKFEFGNKPTDWTPAPEDVEGEISTVSNKVSTLEQSVDGFKATVSSTYATKSDLDDTNSKLPWATQGWVDASAYDPNYWIPFVASDRLPTYGYGHITVTVALNSGTKPSWSTHAGGFSVEFDVEAKASGWGTSIQEAIINRDTYTHCYSSPVSYKQLGYGSKAILYLRGGGRYYVRTSWATTWTGFPEGYTWTSGEYSQSAPAYASRPTPEGYMYGTKTEINQLSDRITANVTDISSLGTRMSSVEQTAEGLTVSLSNTQSTANTAVTNAANAQSTANTASSKADTAQSTANTAVTNAANAQSTAQNAAKTATNYLNFSNGGLVVGNMTASTLGNNVLIDTDSVDIRNGTTVLASYKADTIELGKNSPQSIIDLCDGTAQLTNKNTVSGTDWYRLGITSRDEIGLETSGQVAMDTYYETASGESASGVFRLSSSNPWVDQLGVIPMAYISVGHRTSDVQKRSEFSLADDYAGITQTYSATDVDRTTIFDVVANSTKSAVEMTTDRLEMLRNNSKIYGVSPNRVKKAVFIPQNQYGNTIIGYDNYTNGSGNTNIYGQDISIASSEAGNVSYRPYYRGNGLESSGDTITMKIRTAGFVTSSGQSIQFTVPLAKPIIGNPTVTATSVDGFQLRCNGLYTHGSSASAYAKPDSYSVVTTNGGNNVVITASFSTTTNIINNTVTVGARNNSAIGIYWSGQLTITFG